MVAGTAMVAAAPAVVAAGIGVGVFALSKRLRRGREHGATDQQIDAGVQPVLEKAGGVEVV